MADVAPMARVKVSDLLADFVVRLEVLELLQVVPILVEDRRPTVLHRANHEVQVPATLGPFVEGVEAEEVPDDLLEAGLGIIETEADAIARVDVHPFQELVIEDARLLEDAALLRDVVLRLRHGAKQETHRPS